MHQENRYGCGCGCAPGPGVVARSGSTHSPVHQLERVLRWVGAHRPWVWIPAPRRTARRSKTLCRVEADWQTSLAAPKPQARARTRSGRQTAFGEGQGPSPRKPKPTTTLGHDVARFSTLSQCVVAAPYWACTHEDGDGAPVCFRCSACTLYRHPSHLPSIALQHSGPHSRQCPSASEPTGVLRGCPRVPRPGPGVDGQGHPGAEAEPAVIAEGTGLRAEPGGEGA